MKMYGISNCDSVKKAKKILSDQSIDFEFIDFKKNPPTLKDVNDWAKLLGEIPVNKRGTTFRKIKDIYEVSDEKEKINLLVQNFSAIKRPILMDSGKLIAFGLDQVKEKYCK